MTDPIITDDEKDALLEGISKGDVEVHSNSGPTYAEVNPFEVGPRSRLVTNSFPRLQNLNRQFASRIDKHVEQLLNAESNVEFSRVQKCVYSDFSDRSEGLSLVFEFSPKPLDGSALINLDSVAMEMLVETFFGGDGNELTRQEAEHFSPGEVTVATLFCNLVLSITKDVWHSLVQLEPELVAPHLSSSVISCIDGGDSLVNCEFKLNIGERSHPFNILWPVTTVAALLPVLEGQKRERDATKDAHWERSLRARVVDSDVNISSGVGKTQMTLGDVAHLNPGDVINISNPRKSTVFAHNVPIFEGHFGVHDGRYAVEATNWLTPSHDVTNTQ